MNNFQYLILVTTSFNYPMALKRYEHGWIKPSASIQDDWDCICIIALQEFKFPTSSFSILDILGLKYSNDNYRDVFTSVSIDLFFEQMCFLCVFSSSSTIRRDSVQPLREKPDLQQLPLENPRAGEKSGTSLLCLRRGGGGFSFQQLVSPS